ncbi:PACE efflux transporter [Marinobacter sediminum]|uniref:PACE efflux transporter n=1 Tax=Marinobacter sediminum TaxID=256323 RepID=UPI001939A86F|nr:PACE efflux transporter [Marinobacter sediminum]
MRTTKDRIRQAISFEVIGLLLSIPLAAFTFGYDLGQTGVLGIVGATMATVWNYAFNLAFDHGLKRLTCSTRKTLPARFVHAISFELGLMIAFLPVIAWWMGIGLIEALIVDVAFVVFYLVYAFVFTWCYDTVFPDPDTGKNLNTRA